MKTRLTCFAIVVVICSNCSDKCFMANSDKWQKQTQGTDVTKQVNALAELIAGAEADISELSTAIKSGRAKADLKLSWDLDKKVKKDKYKEVVWDTEAWHDIQRASRVYCAVQQEIQANFYRTDEQYNRALTQLEDARNYLLSAKKKAEKSTTQ